MMKHGLTVDNVAIGGTTAAGWARDKMALKEAVDNNPDAKYVWLTIGGNDSMPKLLSNTPIQSILDQLNVDSKIFLDELFKAHPHIKVV